VLIIQSPVLITINHYPHIAAGTTELSGRQDHVEAPVQNKREHYFNLQPLKRAILFKCLFSKQS